LLRAIPDVEIYGETDVGRCQRAGAISFNIHGVHHGLTAAALNDYFGIAVRNECFCAHPYVREMITEALAKEDDNLSLEELESLAEMQRGMVRASFGIYTTRADVEALASAVADIGARRTFYTAQYEQLDCGDFVHKTFKFEPERLFSIEQEVATWLEAR
jgi:cysteine desulfurase/selenocysteine lyase